MSETLGYYGPMLLLAERDAARECAAELEAALKIIARDVMGSEFPVILDAEALRKHARAALANHGGALAAHDAAKDARIAELGLELQAIKSREAQTQAHRNDLHRELIRSRSKAAILENQIAQIEEVVADAERKAIEKSDQGGGYAFAALEMWLNADPEMRYADVMVGESMRWCVRLKQLSFDKPHEVEVAKAEAGTLEYAIHLALQGAAMKEVKRG